MSGSGVIDRKAGSGLSRAGQIMTLLPAGATLDLGGDVTVTVGGVG